jgi:hypothetical protein
MLKHNQKMTMSGMLAATVAALLLLAMFAVGQARAEFGIVGAGGSATNPDGTRNAQAGAHPDFTTKIDFATEVFNGITKADGDLKDIDVVLPPGLVGNPAGLPTCTMEQLANNATQWLSAAACPTDSQVGFVTAVLSIGGPFEHPSGIFNIEAPRGAPALLGFNVAGTVVLIRPELRGSDYGLTAHVTSTSQSISVLSSKITLWGVPADSAHDEFRLVPGAYGPPGPSAPLPSGLPPTAFMTSPVNCAAGPLTTTVRARSWQQQSSWVTASFNTDFNGDPLQVEGCEVVPFVPSFDASVDTTTPDAGVGLRAKLTFPQDGLTDPQGPATGHLKKATVVLPEGLSINPASAGGLTACTDQQFSFGTNDPIQCPLSSRIGTAEATTPLLKEHLTGGVYLRPQNSSDPESGEMFRIALVIGNEERGVLAKLLGSVWANKDTGRLVTTFDDNPQVPIGTVDLQFKGGSRAPLATPGSCGSKSIDAELSSWSGKTVNRQSTFGIDCTPGLGGFNPSISAGTEKPVGGAFSPFNLSITKPDGNAAVNGLSMSLPTGLLAKLKGNLGTQVGTVKAYAGPGANPYMLPGQVYLEGQYGDAPFSLRVVVPAKAGPFDLGEVVVRQKIYVDPITAQVTVVSDPVPTIVKGVPARLQRLDVSVDKAGFIINPTSCDPKAIGGTLNAAGGQTAPINVRFQVGSCSDLALKPTIGLALSGKGQTTDGKHPAVTATVSQPAGQANLKKVRVALPLSLALDPDNAASDDLCSFIEGSKSDPKCPASSVVGQATAVSPILNEPLTGPVYFVKNERKDPKSGRSIKTTPKLVIPLVGENGVKLTLTGASTVTDDQLVTTFDNIPDAQVSSFKMDINGGKKGILVVSDADICKTTQIADQQITGQNNKSANTDVYIQTPDCALKVLSKKVTAKAVTLKVAGLGAGKVTVTGKGIKKTTKTVSKSTVVTITAKRSKGTPGKVTVSFDPAGPAKARKTTK